MSGVTVPTMITSRPDASIPRHAQADSRSLHRQVAGGLTLFDEMPLQDSGALHNPIRTGIHHLFKIGIAQHAGRNVGP